MGTNAFELLIELNRNIQTLSDSVIKNTAAVGSVRDRLDKIEEQQDKNTAWINIAKGCVALAMSISSLIAIYQIFKGLS